VYAFTKRAAFLRLDITGLSVEYAARGSMKRVTGFIEEGEEEKVERTCYHAEKRVCPLRFIAPFAESLLSWHK
jgi:hypothetical protein